LEEEVILFHKKISVENGEGTKKDKETSYEIYNIA